MAGWVPGKCDMATLLRHVFPSDTLAQSNIDESVQHLPRLDHEVRVANGDHP